MTTVTVDPTRPAWFATYECPLGHRFTAYTEGGSHRAELTCRMPASATAKCGAHAPLVGPGTGTPDVVVDRRMRSTWVPRRGYGGRR